MLYEINGVKYNKETYLLKLLKVQTIHILRNDIKIHILCLSQRREDTIR